MVQRKVSNKLGIQADLVKSEKRLANLKPSSYQYQDGKNRGPEMKKKMKRSRSIKLSDIESLRSSSPTLKQNISQPGKPPPLCATTTTAAAAATPQKQIPVRTTYGSPNYMKSTSSSEAKYESSLVSSKRSSRYLKSKIVSDSSNKPARSLTKSSSLKLVRTLTKAPSFKHVRAGSKKCSQAVLCSADVNATRATCSSTLKDSNFPDYLVLNPGGTEVEGTSIMKVCPYTYCSLNVHHHKPMLPLKCFLSARRRMLKAQKTMKLEALSPRKGKPAVEEVEHSNVEQIAEVLSAGSLQFEIDFEENFEQYSDTTSLGADIMEGFPEEEKTENPDKDYLELAAQTEGVLLDGSDFEDESKGSSEENGSISEANDMEWEEGQFPTLEIDSEADDSMKDENEFGLYDGYSSEFDKHDLYGESTTRSGNIAVYGSEKIQADEIFIEKIACSGALPGDSDCEMDGTHQNSKIIESGHVFVSVQKSTSEEEETDLIGVMINSALTEAVNEVSKIDLQVGDVESYCTPEDQQQDKSLHDDDFFMRLQKQMFDSSQNSNKTYQVVTDEDNNGIQETVLSETNQNVAIGEYVLEQETLNCAAGDYMAGKEEVAVTKRSIGVQVPDDLFETDKDDLNMDDNQYLININDPYQLEKPVEDINTSQVPVDEILIMFENQEHHTECKYEDTNVANQNILDSGEEKSGVREVEEMDVEDSSQSDTTEISPVASAETTSKLESTSLLLKSDSNQELPTIHCNQKWTIRSKRPATEEEEMRNFNPREPNFLPMVPDPDAEKVDLKHQMMEERKNSEEWMVDYALRQAVTKLAPARKKKVALLVEAFETVTPLPKFKTHLRFSAPAFVSARPMQACS